MASQRAVWSRNEDFRPHDAGPDLGGPVDRSVGAVTGCEQVERPLGHGDLTESFRQDQRDARLLVAGDGHAEVIPQEIPQVLVVHAAGDDRRGPDLTGPLDRLGGHPRPAHDHAFLHDGLDQVGGQLLVVAAARHHDPPIRFAPDAEDALDQADLGLDLHALVGQELHHPPAQVGLDLA